MNITSEMLHPHYSGVRYEQLRDKVLPLFLPTQKSPKTHERHHGWKANNNEMQQSNKTKTTYTYG